MSRQTDFRDRYLGIVLGLAVGDAFGAPHLFRTRYQIELSHGGALRDMTGGGHHKLAPGEWTAPTAQALATLESYVSSRDFDGLDLACRLVEAHDADPRTWGTELGDLVAHLAQDPEQWPIVGRVAWYESAGVLSGNGACTRAVPVALIRAGSFESFVRETCAIVQMTHFDPRCTESALAVNSLLIRCLEEGYKPIRVQECARFLDDLRKTPLHRETVGNYDPKILNEHPNITPFATFGDEPDAVPLLLRKIQTMTYDDLYTSGYAVHTLGCALWAFQHAESFEDGISAVASLGGDTDKQCALAGALLGARFGMSDIPDRWLKPLKDRARIVSLAEQSMAMVGR